MCEKTSPFSLGTKAKEVTSHVMRKARKLNGFNELSTEGKEKIRETLEQQTMLFYRDLNKLKRQVADQYLRP